MKIIWDWSLDSETHRIVDSARQIHNGFYHLQHFPPLPWTPGIKYLHSGVYLPAINYRDMPELWPKSAKLTTGYYPLYIPSQLAGKVRSELAELNLVSPDFANLQAIAQSTLPKVIQFVHDLSPNSSLPSQITIHPTHFGTGGSFAWTKNHDGIIIFIRADKGIRTLVECLLTCILRYDAMNQLAATWSETEFLVDWLVESSSLSVIIPADPSWSGTLKHVRTTNSLTTQKESVNFLARIGTASLSTKSFTVHENCIYFDSRKLDNLTARETSIMSLLIAKSPLPVSYDDLAPLIFKNDEQFSLAAIAKTIERLRTELNTVGISPHYLATASGIGYYLKN